MPACVSMSAYVSACSSTTYEGGGGVVEHAYARAHVLLQEVVSKGAARVVMHDDAAAVAF